MNTPFKIFITGCIIDNIFVHINPVKFFCCDPKKWKIDDEDHNNWIYGYLSLEGAEKFLKSWEEHDCVNEYIIKEVIVPDEAIFYYNESLTEIMTNQIIGILFLDYE